MAKCKCRKKCCTTKIASNLVSNMPNGCFDVCTNPICGSPSELSLYAPLIYDQIGINLCAEFPIGADISATYPTAVNATASVIDVSYEYGTGNVVITQIPGRPNCYSVTLSNLSVTFAVSLYDENCRLVATLYPTAVYLPPETTSAMMKMSIQLQWSLKYLHLMEYLTIIMQRLHHSIVRHLIIQDLQRIITE